MPQGTAHRSRSVLCVAVSPWKVGVEVMGSAAAVNKGCYRAPALPTGVMYQPGVGNRHSYVIIACALSAGNEAVICLLSEMVSPVTHTVVPVLLSAGNGADIDVPREEDNRTPLHIAANEGHADAVEALLDAGAKVRGCAVSSSIGVCTWAAGGCCSA